MVILHRVMCLFYFSTRAGRACNAPVDVSHGASHVARRDDCNFPAFRFVLRQAFCLSKGACRVLVEEGWGSVTFQWASVVHRFAFRGVVVCVSASSLLSVSRGAGVARTSSVASSANAVRDVGCQYGYQRPVGAKCFCFPRSVSRSNASSPRQWLCVSHFLEGDDVGLAGLASRASFNVLCVRSARRGKACAYRVGDAFEEGCFPSYVFEDTPCICCRFVSEAWCVVFEDEGV